MQWCAPYVVLSLMFVKKSKFILNMSNNSTALALVGNQNTTGVIKYMNNAKNLGVPGMVNLNNMIKRTNVRGMANPQDWELMKLMLVLEPMLTYLIAKVIVAGRRKILSMGKRAPTLNNARNRNLLTNTKAAPLSSLNNLKVLNKAINNAAAKNKNARNVNLIQNGLHMIVFGLITASGVYDTIRAYAEVSTINTLTSKDEFLKIAYNSIILISRVILPLISALVQRIFKRSNTGTKAVILSSVAAVMLATQLDTKALNALRNTVNNVRNLSAKINGGTLGIIERGMRIIDPSITNRKQKALGEFMISARDTLRTIMRILLGALTAATAINKSQNMLTGRKNNQRLLTIGGRSNQRLLTNGSNNVRNVNIAAQALVNLSKNQS